MKVLTLNTWQERGPWKERWSITFSGIKQFLPDIACFQELFNGDWTETVKKETAFKNFIFPKEPCGLVLYTNYDVKSFGVVTLTKSPLEDYFRYALWVELGVKGKKLFVFNTHLSWMPEDGTSRKKQTEELLQLIEKKAGSEEILLMGDLNAPPDSPEISTLIKQGKFRDLFSEKQPKEPGFTWDNKNPYAGGAFHKLPNRRIDFILARNTGPLLKHLISCDRVFTEPDPKGIWASDHFGLLTELE